MKLIQYNLHQVVICDTLHHFAECICGSKLTDTVHRDKKAVYVFILLSKALLPLSAFKRVT